MTIHSKGAMPAAEEAPLQESANTAQGRTQEEAAKDPHQRIEEAQSLKEEESQ